MPIFAAGNALATIQFSLLLLLMGWNGPIAAATLTTSALALWSGVRLLKES